VEYLGNCPRCKHHTIVKTIKQIPHSITERFPQRKVKCEHCGSTQRVTIIGEIVKRPVPTEAINPELINEVQPEDRLIFQLWK
jgi:transposase-like protein